MFNERGFSLFVTLLFLPLILTSSLALLWFFHWQSLSARTLHVCRTELLRAQEKASESLLSLLQMNQEVLILRQQMIVAKAELALALAAEDPYSTTQAEIKIQEIQQQQRALALRQLFLIEKGNWDLNLGLLAARKHLQRELEEIRTKTSSVASLTYTISTSENPTLAIQKNEKTEEPPTYGLKEPFSQQQALHLSWIYHLEPRDSALNKWLPMKLNKEETCAASLKEFRKNFQPILITDKSFWNF